MLISDGSSDLCSSDLFAEHRAAGRALVLATTTPYDLIAPLAEELGFDDVVATRYHSTDGRNDGTLDGEFVWGKGKLRAVQSWATDAGVDMDQSWAYSEDRKSKRLNSSH